MQETWIGCHRSAEPTTGLTGVRALGRRKLFHSDRQEPGQAGRLGRTSEDSQLVEPQPRTLPPSTPRRVRSAGVVRQVIPYLVACSVR